MGIGFKNVKYVLMDIEGTISDIQFVKEVLFPYSLERLKGFIKEGAKDHKTRDLLLQVIPDTSWSDEAERKCFEYLRECVELDRKDPTLKVVQGKIWKEGFENGTFKAPLYPDVLKAWKNWKKIGLRLGIYSSGSVAAQKLFLAHTDLGNLLDFIEDHFDLEIGTKVEKASYRKIAKLLSLDPSQVLFLSDNEKELYSAEGAGMLVVAAIRPGALKNSNLPSVDNFCMISVNQK